jgi:hypothetical protein
MDTSFYADQAHVMSGRGDWMQTFTGRAFYPLAAEVDDIDPRDIAHALSLTCRYGGHVQRFYSVAEHCLLLSNVVAPEHALWALLHDATEAYVGDVIRPLKRNLPAYVEIENRLMEVICDRFGLDPVFPEEVRTADSRILHDERAALLGPSPRQWGAALESLKPLDVEVRGLSSETVETLYLARLAGLTGGHHDRH